MTAALLLMLVLQSIVVPILATGGSCCRDLGAEPQIDNPMASPSPATAVVASSVPSP